MTLLSVRKISSITTTKQEVQMSANVDGESDTAAEAAKLLQLLTSDFQLDSSLGKNKSVIISREEGPDEDLSLHRLGLIASTVANIYSQTGWTVIHDLSTIFAPPTLHWHLTLNFVPPRSQLSTEQDELPGDIHHDSMSPEVDHDSTSQSTNLPRTYVRCGVVRNMTVKRREKQVTTEDYHRLREKDLRDGECSSALVAATVRLEMLHVRPASCVNLDLTPGVLPNRGTSNKGAAFFLYNYARVATILRKHADLVSRGKYPELPPVKSVAPLLLQAEVEQNLIEDCLETYANLVNEMQANVKEHKFPEPHKLCRFLSDMCHPLSRYYRNYHVLTEAKEHLLPLMHARLHLLSAVSRVMERVFSLLDISPPQHM